MKNVKLALIIHLMLIVTICSAQFGSVNKTFSDFGIEDSLSLKDMNVARLILEEPYLFDNEKEMFFKQMQEMQTSVIIELPAVLLRFRLTPRLGISWDGSGKFPSNYITKVYDNSTSSKAKLMVGDYIKSINDCKIKKGIDIRNCLDQIECGDELQIGIERGKKDLKVVTRLQNRMGTYQTWQDDYYLDMMLGNITLDDFNGTLSSSEQEDDFLIFVTPDGMNYKDLNIPFSTILLDTAMSREIIEDKSLGHHQKKLMFKDLRDLPETRPYLFKLAKSKEDIAIAKRFFIKGLMMKMKLEPKLGLKLKFDATKNLSKIIEVEKGSCVEEAGIQEGDYLYSFEGQPITSEIQLFGILPNYNTGSSVKLIVERNQNKKVIIVKLKNYFGDYRNWTPELMDAITDNNFDLEDYHYLKHKKIIRDTSLWDVSVKQLTIASSINLEMGYLPVISFSIDVLFHSEDDKTKFYQAANENNLTVVFVTKKDEFSIGWPTDPLYITMPKVTFKKGLTKTAFQHKFKMNEFFRNVSDKEFVAKHGTSFYFKLGFHIMETYILENDQGVDQEEMMNAYLFRDRNKYIQREEVINSKTKKRND